MKISIVTTLYNSSLYIYEFYTRVSKEVQKLTDDYEIIFVNDGSPDDSLCKAVEIQKSDDKVKVIELSRNFGHHKAIMTGLSYAKSDFVFLIDSDLEEEPELLGKFWQELHRDYDIDVVYGVQENRKGKWFEKVSGGAFWRIFNFLSNENMECNQITSRLMRASYVDAIINFKETEFFFGGVSHIVGFNQKSVKVKKLSCSETTYSLRKKLSLSINAIISFSSQPLLYIFYIGFFVTMFSVLFILKLIMDKYMFGLAFEGWTSIIVSICFFGGLIILFLGIIGIYLSKIFIEVKNRPFSIVKKVHKNV